MTGQLKAFARVGGFASLVSGILFLTRGILEFLAGPPPSSGLEILSWVASHTLLLAFANEATFFAALLLVPAAMGVLYHSLSSDHRIAAVTGCGIIAATVPVLLILDIIQGRLMYPVFGISVHTPDLAEFVVALFYGGLHAVDIIVGIGTFILGLSMRRDPHGHLIAWLAVLVGVLDIVGAYSYLIGPIANLVCQTFFAAWFIVLGLILLPADRISGVALEPKTYN